MIAMTQPEAVEIAWGGVIVGMVGGLALFLYGMELLSTALKAAAGERLRSVLTGLTYNRFTAVLTGVGVTAIIQSSTVTTVLIVGFISAGVMSFQQSIGVIMGSTIGTTFTAQVVAFKITDAALVLIAIGFPMTFIRRERWRSFGQMSIGLGMLFLGMNLMGDATGGLRDYEPFLNLMTRMEHPLIGMLVSIIVTAILQSSTATIGIAIALASQGLVTLPAGIALVLGANVGTCLTAVLVSIGKPREARRAAVVHVIFKTLGALLWVGLIALLAKAVIWISPAHPELEGAARLAAETPRQIANAHTIFNVANVLLFIGFTGPLARLVMWLVPDRPEPEPERLQPKYLEKALLSTPAFALDRARMELGHLGELVRPMVEQGPRAALRGTSGELDRLARRDDEVDALHAEIIAYLARINFESLSSELSEELNDLLTVANTLEQIGDTVEHNLVARGRKRLAGRVVVSDETLAVLAPLIEHVRQAVMTALVAVVTKSQQAAESVEAMRGEVERLADAAARHQTRRLVANAPNRVATYTIELDIIEILQRLYEAARRIARVQLPRAPVIQPDPPPDAPKHDAEA